MARPAPIFLLVDCIWYKAQCADKQMMTKNLYVIESLGMCLPQNNTVCTLVTPEREHAKCQMVNMEILLALYATTILSEILPFCLFLFLSVVISKISSLLLITSLLG